MVLWLEIQHKRIIETLGQMTQNQEKYSPKHHIRIVTAAALFDGHDAAINIMRRILQATGAEVIHLGHNRSVDEIVRCAIQEDAHAIALTSYQGGHLEYLKYMYDLLNDNGAGHIKIFAGGGGVILPDEIKELHDYGIHRIFSPDDGREFGLQGMINMVLEACDYPMENQSIPNLEDLVAGKHSSIARFISLAENNPDSIGPLLEEMHQKACNEEVPVLGITGTGGSGKSSTIDELVLRFTRDFPNKKIGILSVDPSRRKSGGALLGDRIRMNAIHKEGVYMRSLATRQSNLALSKHIKEALCILKSANFDFIILETSGIGQSDTEITDHSDLSMYIMTPEFGAPSQLEKIDMLDFADVIAINKSDKRGAEDALRHVRKQYSRNHNLWSTSPEDLPIVSTIASRFNDDGTNKLYILLLQKLKEKTGIAFIPDSGLSNTSNKSYTIIPPERVRYLSEISEKIRVYNAWVQKQSALTSRWQALESSKREMDDDVKEKLHQKSEEIKKQINPDNLEILKNWPETLKKYKADEFIYQVRGKDIKVETFTTSLSHTKIPKISLPRHRDMGEILRWNLQENVPGQFPYAAGVFPFKRENEDPTRMFAGEGGPERTNQRFHYVSKGMPAIRLSTAFDSVTLYGEDPDRRPDIYGKIGNSGVSIACLDDAKKLYSGFDLCAKNTSVSMTINGPAPTMMAYFLNAAIDQQCEIYIKEHQMEQLVEEKLKEKYDQKNIQRPAYQGKLPNGHNGLGLMLLGLTGDEILGKDIYARIKKESMSMVRGTVQADILKEDQAQNTCIFSVDFSLKLMGDVQQYFIDNSIQNFYSVSISGYHIAEAGANPITQLAFTLANGFTYVEYYRSRGMNVDDFAPNFSFFFSNGIDAEYAVIGRVARIIWAKAMKQLYGASDRSQKLKYHIQTSGRSLHAQEIDFNDIRTTLQALYAIYDNCNSLHTNAYDEAITTPTEESVRRAMAIQMIINHELGMAKNQNPLQGSYIIEELTELVEEAVLLEFDRITDRGGVPGAMETMYQRSRIQEESMYYEHLKNNGELPIMGVNTFLSSKGSPTIIPGEVIRATSAEKEYQITMLTEQHKAHEEEAKRQLNTLTIGALKNENLFEHLMNAAKSCSIGQLTQALFEVGGQYRRNM